MKDPLLVCLMLLILLPLLFVGCPWHRPPVPPVPPIITPPPVPPSPPVQAAQKWLVYGIPALFILAILLGVMGIYLKNSLALYGSGGCILGVIGDIVLLTFWKPIAWVGFAIVCLVLVGVVVLVAIQFRKILTAMTKASSKIVSATTTGEEAKDILITEQNALGVQNAVRKFLGKPPVKKV